MQLRYLACLTFAALLFGAADKKLPIERSSNELVEVSATPILDPAEVQQELGSAMEGIVVVRVQIRPLSDKPVKIDRDDFALLSSNDGQRSTPYSPTQIAGNSALVVSPEGTRGSMTGGRNTGWSMGGMGMGGGGVGTDPAHAKLTTKVQNGDAKAGESPLLKALKDKILPEKSVTEPISGLLYFQMEGKKIKAKDLEFYYKTPAGRLALRFRP